MCGGLVKLNRGPFWKVYLALDAAGWMAARALADGSVMFGYVRIRKPNPAPNANAEANNEAVFAVYRFRANPNTIRKAPQIADAHQASWRHSCRAQVEASELFLGPSWPQSAALFSRADQRPQSKRCA